MEVGARPSDLTGPPERLRAFGPRAATVTVTSRLASPRAAVWEWVATPEGINDEMHPLIRMTLPNAVESLDRVTIGEPVGRSVLLLFGLVPFDYDDLMLARLDSGSGFVERSFMASQRLWEHARTIEDDGSGCAITDRLTWEPRLGLPGRPLRPAIRRFFGHRHSRLKKRFG